MVEPLHALLYTSQLASGTPIQAVAAVIGPSRTHNRADRITGLLVFDGSGFVQYLEGPAAALEDCLQRIAQDPRHTAFRLAYRGTVATEARRFAGFGLGYAVADGPLPSEAIALLDGDTALQRFLDLLPALDLHA
ncbi:BLUF domain-containing protein [uncultured Xylophilus sp.]|uniref:BLUF domain-containing protein n=1 Tax=uncultured Xylophilus sp. TaxID=296832 RepID=UPI0025FD7A71|nr:BLUF domain-containing protein [uncultured Xylophilus sp.]